MIALKFVQSNWQISRSRSGHLSATLVLNCEGNSWDSSDFRTDGHRGVDAGLHPVRVRRPRRVRRHPLPAAKGRGRRGESVARLSAKSPDSQFNITVHCHGACCRYPTQFIKARLVCTSPEEEVPYNCTPEWRACIVVHFLTFGKKSEPYNVTYA